jgi:hypothetical protein
MRGSIAIITLLLLSLGNLVSGDSDELSESVVRGRRNLTEKAYIPGTWTRSAYDNVWKRWPGQTIKPQNYDAVFREHYGLHTAPFDNRGLPMGLKETKPFLGRTIAVDCLVCHGGSILGQSHIGLGNNALDIQSLFEDLSNADGIPYRTPFTFTNVRGTSEAAGMAQFLLGRRNPDLTLRKSPIDLDLHDDLCEDAPAWWLLKKKKTMYQTGGADQRSVRSIMQFMMSPLTPAHAFVDAEADFADIRQFILSLHPPKYPFPIDHDLAKQGEQLFLEHCARCHGTYGPNGHYPNKIIPIDEIGTDRRRSDGLTEKFGQYYDQTWFAKEKTGWITDGYQAIATNGYQAPPLDGIWASAPYFHNGSAPTVYHVLNSAARPKRFTRSYKTDAFDYDSRLLGWKFESVESPIDPHIPAFERRKVYDTTLSGRHNLGHSYGDQLTDTQRLAIIEFMKGF